MRFYVDECLPDRVAQAGRQLGLDITSTREVGRAGATDPAQLMYAASEGRSIVTYDYRDFHFWTEHFREAGRPHAGVVLVPNALARSNPRRIAVALVELARAYPEGLPPYAIVWLTPGARGA